jgi:N6-adenosine-specific RNA methylase IME4
MYSIIYADPPWNYAGRTQQNGKESTGSADTHYPTMKLEELKQLKIPTEKDCLLFMWSSSPHLQQAIELMNAWGFEYKTIAFVWEKQRVNPSYYTLSQCEVCLVGKKGNIPRPRGARNIRQFLSEMRGRHSQKPAEVRNRITQMFPTQKKVELFAREVVEGWDRFGNEVESNVELSNIKPILKGSFISENTDAVSPQNPST